MVPWSSITAGEEKNVSVSEWIKAEARQLPAPEVLAYVNRCILRWTLRHRDDTTCQKLLDKIEPKGFHQLIPKEQLFTGKDLTVPITRNNSGLHCGVWAA